jgi:hypothetical protein
MSDRALRAFLAVAAAANLLFGLWLAIAPRSVFDAIGDFGAFDAHAFRDVATWYLALGAALAIAVVRPRWRVPALVVAALQYGLHALNHLLDIGEAEPGWVGPFDVVALAAAAAVFAWLAWEAARSGRGDHS